MQNYTQSRRNFLKLAALAGCAGVVSVFPGRRLLAADLTRELTISEGRITVDGEDTRAIMMGGSVPAPVLRWREGETVVIHVHNALDEPTSVHWHGLLLEGVMDGAPGFNGYQAIPAGETYTYRFELRQSGTYWYHSHSALQEQAGMYGAIIIDPAGRDPVRADRDYVVLLSDHTRENPGAVLSNLKAMPGYYNKGKRTVGDFFRDIRLDGLGRAMQDRLDWGDMRMDPTDLADVTGYRFLVNGRGPEDNWTGLFEPGERLRLRFINASAMSFFDVRLVDLPMTVVAADGQYVAPVRVDEFRFGVGETLDVVVRPTEERAFTLLAEPLDRSGYARATLAPREGMSAEIPPLRPRVELSMADMGAMHAGMGHGDHGAMDHGSMDHSAHGGMDHSAHGAAMPDAAPPERLVGWEQAGTAPGLKALSYADLRSLAPNADTREPEHEILIRLTGIMERYIWTLNGRRFVEDEPIRVQYGQRVRLRFVNETMMAHPMHLHGMFMELENGQDGFLPRKHVVVVPPGREVSAVLTANEPGDWPFHCHLLYHMASGMMTRFIVEPTQVANLERGS